MKNLFLCFLAFAFFLPLCAWAQKKFPIDSSQIKVQEPHQKPSAPAEDVITFSRKAAAPVAVKSLSAGTVISVNIRKDTSWVITIKDMQKQYIYHGIGTTKLKQGDNITEGSVIAKLTPYGDTVELDFAMVENRKSYTHKQLLKYFGQ